MSCGCDSTSACLVDRADQAGQHRRLRRGEDAVQDGVDDQRQLAQQPGGAQLRPGGAGGAVLDLGEPPGDGARPAGVRVGHAPAGELVQPTRGGGQPALQPADQRRHRPDPGLQRDGVQPVERFADQRVDQRQQRCTGGRRRCHDTNLSASSDRAVT